MSVKMKVVTACFKDWPGSPLDLKVRALFEKYGGKLLGSGIMIITGERDVEYKLPLDKVASVNKELIELGCTIYQD